MRTEAELRVLAASSDWEERLEAAMDEGTTGDILGQLARDEDSDVRYAAARNPRTPETVLIHRIQRGIEGYAGVAAVILTRVATSRDRDVRCDVARNAATPAHALAMLAKDAYSDVRYWVACHASTPTAVLKKLEGDKNEDVRAEACARLAANKHAGAPGGMSRLTRVEVAEPEGEAAAEALRP